MVTAGDDRVLSPFVDGASRGRQKVGKEEGKASPLAVMRRRTRGRMYSFADEVLNRVRTPPQALADLMARYKGMDFNHPGRLGLAQMIAQLKPKSRSEREQPSI